MFQSGNLIPALTAADQPRLVHRLAGKTDGSSDGRAADGRRADGRGFDPGPLLASVGMEHRAHNRPGALSGGERQRVGIARALVTRPALLLVDEPTAALDRARSREVVQLLAAQSREQGVATVMVTHDHDVLDHCDRVLEMVDGAWATLPDPLRVYVSPTARRAPGLREPSAVTGTLSPSSRRPRILGLTSTVLPAVGGPQRTHLSPHGPPDRGLSPKGLPCRASLPPPWWSIAPPRNARCWTPPTRSSRRPAKHRRWRRWPHGPDSPDPASTSTSPRTRSCCRPW